MSKMQIINQNEVTVSIIGLGGLGCPALLSLCNNWENYCTKILNLNLIDHDDVALSNLNRQILFSASSVEHKKIDVAHSAVVNACGVADKKITFTKIDKKLTSKNIASILGYSDVIIDCSDDAELKVNLNQYSVLTRKTLIYGGVHGFEGVALAILPNGPCLNCVFGSFENDELCELGGTCRSGGVVGGIAGIVGLLQVENLLAIYSESSEAFTPHLRTVNQFGQIRQMKINADINCLNGCGIRPRKLVDLTNFKCPDTFVYAKLTLEKLKSHDYVELEFASESILHNVSDSIQKEGYKNLKKLFNPEFNKFNLIVETKNK